MPEDRVREVKETMLSAMSRMLSDILEFVSRTLSKRWPASNLQQEHRQRRLTTNVLQRPQDAGRSSEHALDKSTKAPRVFKESVFGKWEDQTQGEVWTAVVGDLEKMIQWTAEKQTYTNTHTHHTTPHHTRTRTHRHRHTHTHTHTHTGKRQTYQMRREAARWE